MFKSLTQVMEDIPEIPSKGLPWKKVYGLIGLTGVGLGTAVGTTAWGGVENGNKNAVLVQTANLATQKASLETQIKELETKAEQKDAEAQSKAQELEEQKRALEREKDILKFQKSSLERELGYARSPNSRLEEIQKVFQNPINGWKFPRGLTIL